MRKLGVSMPNSEQTNKLSEFVPVLRQLRSAACNGDKTKDVFTNKSARKETGLTPEFSKLPKMVFYTQV